MMRALIVGASPELREDAFYRDLLASAKFVVAADAAAEWCLAVGRAPDLAVGDFDSAEPGAPERLRASGIEVVEYRVDKDDSDLDLAVTAARARGCDSITLTACMGGRLDHTLASLGTLVRAGGGATADLQEPSFAAWTVGGSSSHAIELATHPGSLFSVFALGAATDVAVRGGMFLLNAASLPTLSSLGLSNVAASPRVSVSVADGVLVVLIQVAVGERRPARICAQ